MTIRVPELDMSTTEVYIVEWLVSVGDRVARGQSVALVESDKAQLEIEATDDGVLASIEAPVGATVRVGSNIGTLVLPAGEVTETLEDVVEPAPPALAGKQSGKDPTRIADHAAGRTYPPLLAVRASPAARRVAKEMGVSLADAFSDLPAGGTLVTETMVRALSVGGDGVPAASDGTAQPSRARSFTAKRLDAETSRIPTFTVASDIDLTDWGEPTGADNADTCLVDRVIQAVVSALDQYPAANARFQDGELDGLASVDVGLAMEVQGDVYVGALRNLVGVGVAEIARQRSDMSSRAAQRRLRLEELGRANATVVDLSSSGVERVVPFINPPEPFVVGIGAPRTEMTHKGLRRLVHVSLVGDNRSLSPYLGARLLQSIKLSLESPA